MLIDLLSGDYTSVGMIVLAGLPTVRPGPRIMLNKIEGDFFQAAGGVVLRGHDFGPRDTATSPKVAIINETAARHFFADEEPLARKIRLAGVDGVAIAGIVRDSNLGHRARELARERLIARCPDSSPCSR